MDSSLIPEYFIDGTLARNAFEFVGATFVLASLGVAIAREKLPDVEGIRQAQPYIYGFTASIFILAFIVGSIEFYELVHNHGTETLMSRKAIWFAFAAAVIFYWLRGTFTCFYGAMEVMFGITGLIVASSAPALTRAGQVVALAAGVYVIVRGLDNIDKGLSPSAQRRWRSVWQFPKEQPPLPDPLTPER